VFPLERERERERERRNVEGVKKIQVMMDDNF
jgi:hypothetical protein